MALELNGTTGVSLVQDGVITDANLPAGSVLQVVQNVYTTGESTTSSSFVNTGLVASITPSSTSNKILVFVTNTCQLQTSGRARFTLIRNATTTLHTGDSLVSKEGNYGYNFIVNLHYLDSPSTTSSVSYQLQYRSTDSNTLFAQGSNNPGIITLMEIAG